MNKYLTLICPHCNQEYFIENSKYRHIRDVFLEYAICPHCNKPRTPSAWKDKAESRCRRCKVPVKKGHRWCDAHYIANYRKRKKLLKNRDLVLSQHGKNL